MRRNFFSATREPFKGNDFGFSIGGPVYIPKVYNGKNKTFFFVLIGGIRERKEQRFNQIVPTLAQRAGIFRLPRRPFSIRQRDSSSRGMSSRSPESTRTRRPT